MGCVGKSVPRIDALAKVTGKAKYTGDYFFEDCLVAKIYRSTIANGWVKDIDIRKAQALPGVELVVTYKDVPSCKYPTAGHPYSLDPNSGDIEDKNILTNRVRYYGDEIAAVVAVDELTAEKALKLIRVEYEEYEPILSAEDALKEGAVEIHEGTKNIIRSSEYSYGDYEKAADLSDYSFEDKFKTTMVQHVTIEPQVVYAYLADDDRVHIITPTQCPYTVQRSVGQALGIPWHKIKIIKPYIGGGFGSKQDPVLEPLAAFLALKLKGRVIKLEYTREESLLSRVRHPFDLKISTEVTKDGKILSANLDAISINGAYASHGHAVMETGLGAFRQLYDYQAMKEKGTTIYTNMPVAGAMRGYGVPQVMFALESHVDDIAYKLNIDPVELRLKNIRQPNFYEPVAKMRYYSNGLRECILKGKELIEWDKKRSLYKNQTGMVRRGVGMACFCYQSNTYPAQMEIAGARVILKQDGSVQLQIGATEIGQGSDTALAQIVADTVGVPFEKVYVVSLQDTDTTPFDTGSYASRQTYVAGLAVQKAAEIVKRKILERVCVLTNFSPEKLEISDDLIKLKDDGSVVMSVEELALDAYYNKETAEPITADITYRTTANALSYGCTFVEIEVDIPVGQIKILNVYSIHDAGRIINPKLAEGQVHGGTGMGLGYVLSEQLMFDPKTGKPLNNNLLDYKVMTALDMPDVHSEFIMTNEPTTPYGNKALGEPPTITQAPAVRNALLHATGVRINELPLTPQRLVTYFKSEGLL